MRAIIRQETYIVLSTEKKSFTSVIFASILLMGVTGVANSC